MDKIISIIEEHGKLSRQKVKDILKTEYNSKNITLINKALEDGVQTGKLIKKGQTFSKNLGYKSPNKEYQGNKWRESDAFDRE